MNFPDTSLYYDFFFCTPTFTLLFFFLQLLISLPLKVGPTQEACNFFHERVPKVSNTLRSTDRRPPPSHRGGIVELLTVVRGIQHMCAWVGGEIEMYT